MTSNIVLLCKDDQDSSDKYMPESEIIHYYSRGIYRFTKGTFFTFGRSAVSLCSSFVTSSALAELNTKFHHLTDLTTDHITFFFLFTSLTDVVSQTSGENISDVNKTKFFRPRPKPPEVNKGTWRI